MRLPHDHVSIYADVKEYLVDAPDSFIAMVEDMQKDDEA